MKVKIISTTQPQRKLTTLDMEVGDIGELNSREMFSGHILKAHDVLVLLENSEMTWDVGNDDPKFQLDSILPKGTVLELTL